MLDKLAAVKRANKVNFANYLEKATGQVIDPDSIFDCQEMCIRDSCRRGPGSPGAAKQSVPSGFARQGTAVQVVHLFAQGGVFAAQLLEMCIRDSNSSR